MIRKTVPAASRRRLLWGMPAIAAASGLALVGLWLVSRSADRAAPPTFLGAMQEFQAVAAPRQAPEISFSDLGGRKLTLADFRGRVTLINFWATWCAPCVEEMPSLGRLQARFGGARFTVAAISVDREGPAVVEPFVGKLATQDLPIYIDRPGASMRAFIVRGLPTSILIDAEGRELGRIEGMARWDTPAAEAFVRYYAGVDS